MLYPAAGRFAACRPGRSDTSFRTLVKRMHDIAAQDNGMPETP